MGFNNSGFSSICDAFTFQRDELMDECCKQHILGPLVGYMRYTVIPKLHNLLKAKNPLIL